MKAVKISVNRSLEQFVLTCESEDECRWRDELVVLLRSDHVLELHSAVTDDVGRPTVRLAAVNLPAAPATSYRMPTKHEGCEVIAVLLQRLRDSLLPGDTGEASLTVHGYTYTVKLTK